MFYKILIGAAFSLCVTACASSPPTAAVAKQPPAGCVAQGATRIAVSPTACAAAGHIWTQDAMESTGATTPGAALRLLDPAVTVHGR